MSLVYIVDGYNVIKSSPLFMDKELRDARSVFFSYLELHRPQGAQANKLIVVFDGSPQVSWPAPERVFDVIFTQGESADDKIKDLVAKSRQPKNIVVVTDDKGLGLSARALGARLMSTTEFLGKSIRQDKNRPPDVKMELNIVEREKIPEEMRRIWLGKK